MWERSFLIFCGSSGDMEILADESGLYDATMLDYGSFKHIILGGIGICGVSAVKAHWGINMGMIITGGIMPLVPGVLLTNAVRDLLAGHILSGASRMIEGLITACALGMGIALVLRFS